MSHATTPESEKSALTISTLAGLMIGAIIPGLIVLVTPGTDENAPGMAAMIGAPVGAILGAMVGATINACKPARVPMADTAITITATIPQSPGAPVAQSTSWWPAWRSSPPTQQSVPHCAA